MTGAPAPRDRWLGVELRHLAALSAIAHEGSFRAAADALGYVQSAVSQQVAHLEALVGARLVERERGAASVALTPAGNLLLEHVGELLRRYDDARADLAGPMGAGAGGGAATARARVGLVPSLAARWLPGLLAAAPGIEPVPAADSAALETLLRDGAVDVAAGELPGLARGGAPDGVAVEPLVEDPLVLVVAAGSPLARRGAPPAPAELGRLPLIGTGPSPAQDALVAWLAAHGVSSVFAVRCDADTAVQPLVAAGLGVAVCPALALRDDHPGTVILRLDPAPPPRAIVLAVREAAGPAAAAIAAAVRDQAVSAAAAASPSAGA